MRLNPPKGTKRVVRPPQRELPSSTEFPQVFDDRWVKSDSLVPFSLIVCRPGNQNTLFQVQVDAAYREQFTNP